MVSEEGRYFSGGEKARGEEVWGVIGVFLREKKKIGGRIWPWRGCKGGFWGFLGECFDLETPMRRRALTSRRRARGVKCRAMMV
jgi:hypothetical protein